MYIFLCGAFALGILSVLQGGMNKEIGESWGLPAAVFLNSLILATASFAFYLVTRNSPQWFSPIFHDHGSFKNIPPIWWVLPGTMGFFLVMGIPPIISKIGAMNMFIGLVCAQVVTSILWDYFWEQHSISMVRLLGAVFSIIGAVLVSRK